MSTPVPAPMPVLNILAMGPAAPMLQLGAIEMNAFAKSVGMFTVASSPLSIVFDRIACPYGVPAILNRPIESSSWRNAFAFATREFSTARLMMGMCAPTPPVDSASANCSPSSFRVGSTSALMFFAIWIRSLIFAFVFVSSFVSVRGFPSDAELKSLPRLNPPMPGLHQRGDGALGNEHSTHAYRPHDGEPLLGDQPPDRALSEAVA